MSYHSTFFKTYALDGQHRLYAIKANDGTASLAHPPGFQDETINVIFVVPAMSPEMSSLAYRHYSRL